MGFVSALVLATTLVSIYSHLAWWEVWASIILACVIVYITIMVLGHNCSDTGKKVVGSIFIAFCAFFAYVVALIPDSHSGSFSASERGNQSLNSREPSLTGSMNGYAWSKATDASRYSLAADISRRLNENGTSDCSANFIYDALNEAFNTSDTAIMKTQIAEVVGFCVAMAKALPESQRNY
jgi:hypothetical protein